jgi:hypothetical protein
VLVSYRSKAAHGRFDEPLYSYGADSVQLAPHPRNFKWVHAGH